MFRRGEPARSNTQLVERLASVARSLDRPLADPATARGAFGLAGALPLA
ncbi:MAG: 3-keto-5-aminohexanoate cleavage protein [Solirubrobacteraceae bacterium]